MRFRCLIISLLLCALAGCVGGPGSACLSDEDCEDGVYCNGLETCVNFQCVPGIEPCCDCIEEFQGCGECCDNDDCDDGLFCNGEESCVNFMCIDGSNPCVVETCPCVEETDECRDCYQDSDCDDGLFCNGIETCGEIGCTGGESPCEANQTCTEGETGAICMP